MASSSDRMNKACKKYYRDNLLEERAQSRDRARKRKESWTPEEYANHLSRHREAQARYRSTRRKELVQKSTEYKQRKREERKKARDDALLQEMDRMIQVGEDATFDQAAKNLGIKLRKGWF